MTSVVCVSHSQDVDGLVCAALLRMAKDAQYILADYSEFPGVTSKVTEGVDEFYLCDLALEDPIISELKRISKLSEVTYVDHHPLSKENRRILKQFGVRTVHSTEMCAGALTYRLFRRELSDDALLLAGYASLSDYPSPNRGLPFSTRSDPQMLAFEATLLTYSLARRCDDDKFRRKIVDNLSLLKYPHNIESVVDLATKQLEYVLDIMKNTDRYVSYSGNVAYVEVAGSTGVVANALMHALEKPIVICYRKCRGGDVYYLSVRSKNPKYNLGVLTSEIAGELGGSGGGHPLAAAAQLSGESLSRFIQSLDRRISDDD